MRILITGGNGFLGKRLGRQLKSLGHTVILASRNNKNNRAAEEFSGCESVPLDITSIDSVRDTVIYAEPDVIIHGAATKFVDLSERHALETVDVNVGGSRNVARVAIERGVSGVIGISTDKASPPVRNIYGLSKSLMERLFCSLDGRAGVRFACVRYGNVAWSTGSVLCIWRKMVTTTKCIGTTGPDMFRYFFTVDEAVNLVLTAMTHLDEFHGKVVSREMKAAQLKSIIYEWQNLEPGLTYKLLSERPGERVEEFLIGEEELPWTEQRILSDLKHYIIDFSKRQSNPLDQKLSSRTASMLSSDEIAALISNPPFEEIYQH